MAALAAAMVVGGGASAQETRPGGGASGPRAMGRACCADPRPAARVLRSGADMLKGISEVLARHAAEFEKGQ